MSRWSLAQHVESGVKLASIQQPVVSERFDPDSPSVGLMDAERLARYWWAAQAVGGKDVLDTGCGVGQGARILADAGAKVIGVSPDPVAAIKRFHAKQSLNFTLLADSDHSISEAYGAWVEKSKGGESSWGVQRSTFIIDGSGTVADVIPKASPKTHDDEVLKALRAAA